MSFLCEEKERKAALNKLYSHLYYTDMFFNILYIIKILTVM